MTHPVNPKILAKLIPIILKIGHKYNATLARISHQSENISIRFHDTKINDSKTPGYYSIYFIISPNKIRVDSLFNERMTSGSQKPQRFLEALAKMPKESWNTSKVEVFIDKYMAVLPKVLPSEKATESIAAES